MIITTCNIYIFIWERIFILFYNLFITVYILNFLEIFLIKTKQQKTV